MGEVLKLVQWALESVGGPEQGLAKTPSAGAYARLLTVSLGCGLAISFSNNDLGNIVAAGLERTFR